MLVLFLEMELQMRFVMVFVFSKEKSPYSNAQRAAGVCQ